MDRLAARMELAVNRVPEHSTAFLREFRSEANLGLERGSDRIKRMIEAGDGAEGKDAPAEGADE
jgi:hypothetical protein